MQPRMSSSRSGVGVNVEVVMIGVVDGASDNVSIKGRAVVVGVAYGMNGGGCR